MAERDLRIDFERSGGFAGLSLRTSLDAAELDDDEAGELESLVESADLAGLAAREAHGPGEPDRYQYDLTVDRAGERRQITLGETQVPEELRPLLDRLEDRAKRDLKGESG